MTTGKIKNDPYATGHPLHEGTSYIPVNFQKVMVNLVEDQSHMTLEAHVYKNYH